MKKTALVLTVLTIATQTANAENFGDRFSFFNNSKDTVKAFFGDKVNNKVLIVDVNNMEMSDEVETGHEITYTADKVANMNKVYVVNRGSNAIDVIQVDPVELTKTIDLKHFPRSAEAMNKDLNLSEVSGMDKPMASIIDTETDTLIASVGEDKKVDKDNNPNSGGSHATGHPFWLDKNHFALLDRYNRKIVTYFIEQDNEGTWVTKKLNTLDTPTSLHQIIPSKGNYLGEKGYFYATAEGAKDIYPAIMKYHLIANKGLEEVGSITLKKEGVDVNDMWLHHGDFHPTQKLIYVGSGDGTLFIVNYDTMKIEKTLKAGKGAGHTMMNKAKNMAIVVNHKDVFVTLVDLEKNEKIADVRVSDLDDKVGKATIQAHPKYHVSEDGRYFYAFLTEEGKMFELDLDTQKITRTVDVGGKPAQGSFVKIKKSRGFFGGGFFGGGFFSR